MTSPTLRHYFRNVQLVDPRIHRSDHHVIKATIKTVPRKAQRKYLQGRKKFPLRPITPNSPTFTQADQLFMELKSYVPRPKQKQSHLWADWLSTHTKQLIRKRSQLAKSNTHKKDNRPELRRLSREIDKSRKEDTKRRTETAAAEIEACIEEQDLQGGWFKLNLWMKHRGDKAFRPSFEDMTRLTDEMEDMHKRVDPQEEPIPTLIAPYEIDDSVPTEDEITLAVKRLKSGKSPGATKMTAAHLKKWYRQAHPLKEEDIPQPEAWNKLVELVQHTWEHSELPQELYCVQVMIPKPDGGSRGIGLLEIVLKVLECIINSCVSAKVKFHDCLHGFRAARGTDQPR